MLLRFPNTFGGRPQGAGADSPLRTIHQGLPGGSVARRAKRGPPRRGEAAAQPLVASEAAHLGQRLAGGERLGVELQVDDREPAGGEGGLEGGRIERVKVQSVGLH